MQKNIKAMQDRTSEVVDKESFSVYLNKAMAAAIKIDEANKKGTPAGSHYDTMKLCLFRAFEIDPHDLIVHKLIEKFHFDIEELKAFAQSHSMYL